MLTRTHFTQEPAENDRSWRGGLYQFKRDDPNDEMVYYCNGDEAKVRKLVNLILNKTDDQKLLELIYEYGEARVDAARGDWYEDQAGDSL